MEAVGGGKGTQKKKIKQTLCNKIHLQEKQLNKKDKSVDKGTQLKTLNNVNCFFYIAALGSCL